MRGDKKRTCSQKKKEKREETPDTKKGDQSLRWGVRLRIKWIVVDSTGGANGQEGEKGGGPQKGRGEGRKRKEGKEKKKRGKGRKEKGKKKKKMDRKIIREGWGSNGEQNPCRVRYTNWATVGTSETDHPFKLQG